MMWSFIKKLLGLKPSLPFMWEVKYPVHGMSAKNRYSQEVIWDEKVTNSVTGKPGKWVMPQNFTDRDDVTIT
jgi:hypothetical protein